MPTYDFICDKCDTVFEKTIALKDYDSKNMQACPKCGDVKSTRRYYTPPGIKFGAGFFRDGYRSAKDVSRSNDD